MIMFKFVTIYRRVDDEMALENFFSGTQLPLSEQLPGLQKTELSRIDGKPGGNSRYYLMYELYFESYPQFALALSSPPGQQLPCPMGRKQTHYLVLRHQLRIISGTLNVTLDDQQFGVEDGPAGRAAQGVMG